MPTSGKTLRRERRAAEVATVDQALEMGISRSTLYTLEKSAEVDPDYVTRYRKAVETLRDAKRKDVA